MTALAAWSNGRLGATTAAARRWRTGRARGRPSAVVAERHRRLRRCVCLFPARLLRAGVRCVGWSASGRWGSIVAVGARFTRLPTLIAGCFGGLGPGQWCASLWCSVTANDLCWFHGPSLIAAGWAATRIRCTGFLGRGHPASPLIIAVHHHQTVLIRRHAGRRHIGTELTAAMTYARAAPYSRGKQPRRSGRVRLPAARACWCVANSDRTPDP